MTQSILKININKIKESAYQGRLLMFGSTDNENADKLLKQLAENIKENGLLNPVVLRVTEDSYEIIDGHRRIEAFRLLGEEKIEAIVKEMNDREAQVMSVVSNLQRKDLYNIERALAFKKILDAGIFKDQKELSKAIGRTLLMLATYLIPLTWTSG